MLISSFLYENSTQSTPLLFAWEKVIYRWRVLSLFSLRVRNAAILGLGGPAGLWIFYLTWNEKGSGKSVWMTQSLPIACRWWTMKGCLWWKLVVMTKAGPVGLVSLTSHVFFQAKTRPVMFTLFVFNHGDESCMPFLSHSLSLSSRIKKRTLFIWPHGNAPVLMLDGFRCWVHLIIICMCPLSSLIGNIWFFFLIPHEALYFLTTSKGPFYDSILGFHHGASITSSHSMKCQRDHETFLY